jgi:hypothetical protein
MSDEHDDDMEALMEMEQHMIDMEEAAVQGIYRKSSEEG